MAKQRIPLRNADRELRQEETLQELARRLRELEADYYGEDKGPLPNQES